MITVLDKNTIDQIAAGEVIERPASVVKELTENALDAGATAITVEIKDGGCSLIRITDNGCGINAEEVATAFLRHATSKIKSALDLMNIHSLGFRGEALSSIASIAKVELLTKTRDAFTGTRYVIEGGEEKECMETACPDGTTFLVKDIFFNTPVRRKFLKSPGTEAGYINEVVEKLALSHTDISFKLISNGRVIMHTSGKGKVKDDFLELYGLDIAKGLVEINANNEEYDLSVTGVIAKPYITRGNRELEAFFVNGRYVKSKILSNAVEDAYKGFMMGHNYPVTALYISTPPDFVDVNVHPTKMELRFENNEQIYKLVFNAVRDELSGKNHIVSSILDEKKDVSEARHENKEILNTKHIPEPFEKKLNEKASVPVAVVSKESEPIVKPSLINEYSKKIEDYTEKTVEKSIKDYVPIPNKSQEKPAETEAVNTESIHKEETVQIPSVTQEMLANKGSIGVEPKPEQMEIPLDLYRETKKEFRLIGQVFKTYWMIEMDNTLFLIDQHAAHEKVLYERTMKTLREKKEFMTQELFPPIIISVSLREKECLNKNIQVFQKLGFELEEFGLKEFKLSGIPAELVDVDYDSLFKELLDALLNDRECSKPDIITDRIATISCKAAVKGNNYLSFEQADKLIHDMFELENPYHCPHGRPTTISFTKAELEKKFKRVL